MNAHSPSGEERRRARFEPSTAVLDALLQRLVTSSAFPLNLLSRERLASHLTFRAQKLGLTSIDELLVRIANDPTEYARIEGLFSPPETWLFRYPESYSNLRTHVARGGAGVYRVLIAGCGGWCEPISVACALRDGAADTRQIEIDAIDRNPHVFSSEPRFVGLEIRGGVPAWAERWFERHGETLLPTREVGSVIRPRVIDVISMVDECLARGLRYDAIVFRNVAIYLDDETRARIFRGFSQLVAADGVLLVGHSETFAAAEATGFVPLSDAGAFALTPKEALRSASNEAERQKSARVDFDQRTRVSTRVSPVRTRTADPKTPDAPRETLQSSSNETARADPMNEPTAASYLALAREFDASGDLLRAWQSIGKALYVDRKNEEALVFAAQLAQKRGDAAESERLRMRALRAHLENESMRDRPA